MKEKESNWDLIQEYGRNVVKAAEDYATKELDNIDDFVSAEEYTGSRLFIINVFLEGANFAKTEIDRLEKKYKTLK